ncbi:MAG: type 4a pilus biogenesis protein PilO [Deltaproteobacteria bacterium]|nr:type 4a pilus biogenesis protein PilO [Deltaproteobacteria bacterium]
MNDLLDRFFELENRQRVMAVAGVLAVVFGTYWYFVYAGRRAETVSVTAKINDLRQQRDAKEKLVANMGELQETVRELGAQLKQAEAQLPDSKEIPDLLSSVSSAGRDAGLEVISFRQRQEELKDFYAEVPVDVTVRGNYHEVAAFFDRVGKLDRIVNVGDILMQTPRREGDEMIVDTACSATTFRFLDERERAEIAKEKAAKAKESKKKK